MEILNNGQNIDKSKIQNSLFRKKDDDNILTADKLVTPPLLKPHNKEKHKFDDTQNNKEILFVLAENVLKELKTLELTPTEENYSIFLHKEIDKQTKEIKRRMQQEIEENNQKKVTHINDLIVLEKEVKITFKQMVNVLKDINNVFAYSQMLKKELLKLSESMTVKDSTNINQANNLHFLTHLNKIDLILNKYNSALNVILNNLKINYNKCVNILNAVKNKSIFNSFFKVYNFETWEKQVNDYHKFTERKDSNNNTILLLKPKLYDHYTEQQKKYLYKILNTIIKNNIRNYDIMTILKNEFFIVYLKHTTVEESEIIINRIKDNLHNSYFSFNNQSQFHLEFIYEVFEVDVSKEISSLFNIKK